MTITSDSIKLLLLSNDRAVARAMVVLLARQTDDEQSQGATSESNGKGFSYYTASCGTYYAKWVLGLASNATQYEVRQAIVRFLASTAPGRALTGNHLAKARKVALYHHKQLVEVALSKAAAITELSATG